MEVYTVSFFGHRRICNSIQIERKLEAIIKELLLSHQYVEFLVGRDGDFDLLVASVIRRCRRGCRSDNSSVVWVLPYMTADFRDNQASYRAYYDEIEVFSGTHYKSAFQERNRHMIDRSNLVVFYVEKAEGGAYSAMKYADLHRREKINIFTKQEISK